MKILVVEDEIELLNSIGKGLRLDGYYVDLAENGEKALELAYIEEYDLIILDLNLPDMFGLDILKELRKISISTKVIILTAISTLETKIDGLDLGANDYMVKPFYFKELEARIRALLRRNYNTENANLCFGDLEFDTAKRELKVKGTVLELTKKEKAIIEYFLLNKDKIISAEELLSHAWDSDADYFSNSVRVHLTTLRKKIKEILDYNPIENKIGEGYFLVDKSKTGESR